MRYHLIDELRWPCAAFVGAQNAFGAFLRFQQGNIEELHKLIFGEEALDWLEAEQPELLRDMLEWMSLMLLPKRQPDTPVPKLKTLDELKTYMETGMQTWHDMAFTKGETKGRSEGEVTGQLKEARGAIALILKTRFGGVSPETVESLEAIDQLGRSA